MVGCRSRRSWTVGSSQRARSWEVSMARRPCPPRPDVRLSPRQYWRCYFNVQRYLSPEVSVHFISSLQALSISGELRTIDSCPDQKLVHARSWRTSLIIARSWKGKKRNQHEQVLPRTNSAFLSRRCRTCIGPATQIKTLFISAVEKKTRKSVWSQRSSQWAGRLTTVRTMPNRRLGGLDDCVHARKSASERVWNLIYRSREARFSETSLRRSLEEVCLPKVIYLNLPATCAGNGSIKVHHC